MALCGLLALTIGYLAGLRFRVMIVLPLEFCALATLTVLTLLGSVAFGEACILFMVFTFALQAGYGIALACPLPMRVLQARRILKA